VIFLGRDVVLEVDGVVLGEVVFGGLVSAAGCLWNLCSSITATATTRGTERKEEKKRRLTYP